MARHTAKSHKIRKVEILVIQIQIVVSSDEYRILELRDRIYEALCRKGQPMQKN